MWTNFAYNLIGVKLLPRSNDVMAGGDNSIEFTFNSPLMWLCVCLCSDAAFKQEVGMPYLPYTWNKCQTYLIFKLSTCLLRHPFFLTGKKIQQALHSENIQGGYDVSFDVAPLLEEPITTLPILPTDLWRLLQPLPSLVCSRGKILPPGVNLNQAVDFAQWLHSWIEQSYFYHYVLLHLVLHTNCRADEAWEGQIKLEVNFRQLGVTTHTTSS